VTPSRASNVGGYRLSALKGLIIQADDLQINWTDETAWDVCENKRTNKAARSEFDRVSEPNDHTWDEQRSASLKLYRDERRGSLLNIRLYWNKRMKWYTHKAYFDVNRFAFMEVVCGSSAADCTPHFHSPVANMVGCGWSRGRGIMLQLPVVMGAGCGGGAAAYWWCPRIAPYAP